MARTYAFYFTVALLVMSVYLSESPRVKITAARDMPQIIAELESLLTATGNIRCGHLCRNDAVCEARCPRCVFNVATALRSCRI